jgi:hypothetical protein
MGKCVPRLSEKQFVDHMARARQGSQGPKWTSWLSPERMGQRCNISPTSTVCADYREQVPLNPDLTGELCRHLGVRHPHYRCVDMLIVSEDTTYVCDLKWLKANGALDKDGGNHG